MLSIAWGQAFRAGMSARHLEITLNVNGEPVAARVEARKTLVDFLRAAISCSTGTPCRLRAWRVRRLHGAASMATRSARCLMLRGAVPTARSVETIEGLSHRIAIADLHPLQDSMRDCNAPAMRLLHARHADQRAQELLAAGDVPSRETIREHLSGNYCRCTGYQAIVDAIEAVAQARARSSPACGGGGERSEPEGASAG